MNGEPRCTQPPASGLGYWHATTVPSAKGCGRYHTAELPIGQLLTQEVEMPQFALADMIETVTSQLLEAEMRSAKRGKPVMQFEECQLELAVALESDAQGGLNVFVIDVQGEAKKTAANTITVKFKRLEPVSGAQAGRITFKKPPTDPSGTAF
jgi:hypothetical protein